MTGRTMPAHLARSRVEVAAVMPRLKAEETLILRPYGVDEECDEAHASLP